MVDDEDEALPRGGNVIAGHQSHRVGARAAGGRHSLSVADRVGVFLALLRPARGRIVTGVVLFGAVLAGGLYAAIRPSASPFDTWVYERVPAGWAHAFCVHISYLGEPPVATPVGLVAVVLAVWRHRQSVAVTCALAPVLAVVLCEAIMKPLIGRQLGGSYSYPSGHVTTATAVLLDFVLLVPGWWRVPAAIVAATGSSLVAVAVVADRQHYPSDAVAGLALAVAVVMIVDGVNRPGLWTALGPVRTVARAPSGPG